MKPMAFYKKSFLKFRKILRKAPVQNSQENTVLFFYKLSGKKRLAQVFSYEFCEILKNIFFIGHLQVTASEHVFSSWFVAIWLH